MSFVRRNAVPVAAAVAAAAAAFAVVALSTGGAEGSAPGAVSGVDDGLAVFYRMGCGGCHELAEAGSVGPIGPSLDAVLPGHTPGSLTAAILNPPPDAAMPPGYGERMSKAELDALVEFLLASR